MTNQQPNKYSEVVFQDGPINVYRAMLISILFNHKKREWSESMRDIFGMGDDEVTD